MKRWTTLIPVLAMLLGGCVTTREVVYRDAPYRTVSETRYYDGGRYYDRSAGHYVGEDVSYRGGDYYYGWESPAWYWDYPAYYSIFWPMYRSWYDPYWFPQYYYGVTYYPRNYFSLRVAYGGLSLYGPLYYSPYRYAWVDNYYDWTPWHGYYPRYRHERDRHAPPPRFGSARNEAERLSHRSDRYGRPVAPRGQLSGNVRETPYGRYGGTRSGLRDADYGSTAVRRDPGVRGLGTAPQDHGVRRVGVNGPARQDPVVRGYGTQSPSRGADYGAWRSDAPQRSYGSYDRSHDANVSAPARGSDRSGARGEAIRYASPAPAQAPRVRDYDASAGGSYARPSIPLRSYDAPAPQAYGAPSRGYDAGRAAPAPAAVVAPTYSAPEPRPATSYERPDARQHDTGADRVGSNRGSSSRGEAVRRVGRE